MPLAACRSARHAVAVDCHHHGMRASPLVATVAPTIAAAVLGNLLVPKAAVEWFRALRQPRMAIPFPAFVAVGLLYYGVIAVVRHRALVRADRRVARLTLVVLGLNEGWNAAFLGRRSTRNGFVGMVLFAVPVLALQRAVHDDRRSRASLAPYTAWVLAYDLPWSYRLWRLNS